MILPTEQIGSIPRPAEFLAALDAFDAGSLSAQELAAAGDRARRETIVRLEATGSPVVTDGEQTKPSFATYPVAGSARVAADGVVLPFADGHTRQLPRLTEGPFRYEVFADSYLRAAQRYAGVPVKQAVIAPSALSLLYPEQGVPGYSRESFLADLLDQAESDVRRCLDAGASVVQLDFTEGRLALKLDPSGALLRSFIELNNRLLDRFTPEERARLGVHSCPGGDQDSTHSLDVDYAALLPDLFRLHAGNFYLQLASEPDPKRVLETAARHLGARQRLFVGVTDPLDPVVESPETVRDRVLLAAAYIAPDQLGTCDDCGFAPFADDVSTSREIAFAKIEARVRGTILAADHLDR